MDRFRDIHPDLKMWEAPAFSKAREGQSEASVAAFLRSKGVPDEIARQAAVRLVTRARKGRLAAAVPRAIMGWGLVLLGVGFSIWSFLDSRGFWILAFGPILLGAWVLYGMKEGDEP